MAIQYLLEIDHPSYGKLRFKDEAQVGDWLLTEKQFWDWGPHSAQQLGLMDLSRRDHLRTPHQQS